MEPYTNTTEVPFTSYMGALGNAQRTAAITGRIHVVFEMQDGTFTVCADGHEPTGPVDGYACRRVNPSEGR